jgi:hypothetical protein
MVNQVIFSRRLSFRIKILKHLDLWDVKRKPPPYASGPPPEAVIIYDESPAPSADDYLIDADYPMETYL